LLYSYGPIDKFLSSVVAPITPPFITPNIITFMSTGMLFPVLFLLSREYYGLAAVLVVLHDMLDRLDGSVARHRKDPNHNSRLGAFLGAVVAFLSFYYFLFFLTFL
jgi:phosphatidylglycerophosphate synthase